MSHRTGFVCTGGCGGFSHFAKNCGTAGCPFEGKALVRGRKCSKCGGVFLEGETHEHK